MNEQSPYEQGNGPIDEKMLLKFLRGELNEQEAAEMEARMAASDFEKDALEGLSLVSPATPIADHVQQINLHLETQLKKKNRGRKKRKISLRWIYLALIVLLGLIVIAYTVLHLHYRQ
ncbi:hypothetical protein [Parasegetibacter sp. NRK P23]|uniref:hypothetical protein n=1 Tax=Parasegetibacter sp. NRK P23 TaxID=2942999 RepID=UPI00204319BA|nr:hypothetical protein [Parasegetibacter sp. NRK P23]MCM5528865.1 hypothetical protein [Parasegetibacter sp. NRK P23]